MRDRARPRQRLTHEQPARARLDRNMYLALGEPCHPLLHSFRRRTDPSPGQLASLADQRVKDDLGTMHIKARRNDPHRASLLLEN